VDRASDDGGGDDGDGDGEVMVYACSCRCIVLQNVDAAASKSNLLREHLSAPKRASPTEEDYDEFDEIPMITSAPPSRPGAHHDGFGGDSVQV
jgi:hypothetical protein